MKINLTKPVNGQNGLPLTDETGQALGLGAMLVSILNSPPHAIAHTEPRPARMVAELRVGIVDKANTEAAEFLPEEKEEILHCVACTQSVLIYRAVKDVLSGAPDKK